MAMYSEKYWAWHHNVEDAGIEVVSFGFWGLILVNMYNCTYMLKMNLDKISISTKSNYFGERTNPWVRCALGTLLLGAIVLIGMKYELEQTMKFTI